LSQRDAGAHVGEPGANESGGSTTVAFRCAFRARGRHHIRAPRWSATNLMGSLAIQPDEGPAPTPKPQRGADQSSSPRPCAAAVHDPPVRDDPASIPSAPSRKRPVKRGVVPHRCNRPCSATRFAGARRRARYLRDKRRTRVANHRRQRCRAEARSPLGTHGADAGAQGCGHLGRRGSGPHHREQRWPLPTTHRAQHTAAPYTVEQLRSARLVYGR